MAERRLQRLLTHGDDDVDTYMSPLRGETYPLRVWASATSSVDESKAYERHLKQLRGNGEHSTDTRITAFLPQALMEASKGRSSPLGTLQGSPHRLSPTNSTSTASAKHIREESPEGGGKPMRSTRSKARFGMTVSDAGNTVIDEPILLCTESSILKARRPSEWGRPTRREMHNVISDYKPTTLKNAAVRQLLDQEASDVVRTNVSGVSHRVQLYSDIPTSSKTYLSALIREVAKAEAAGGGECGEGERGSISQPVQFPPLPSTSVKQMNSSNPSAPRTLVAAASSENAYAQRTMSYLSQQQTPTTAAIDQNSRPPLSSSSGSASAALPPLLSQSQLGMALLASPQDGHAQTTGDSLRMPAPQQRFVPTERAAMTYSTLSTRRDTARQFRKHGIRAGIVADPHGSPLLTQAPTSQQSEVQLQSAIATMNYQEQYRELAIMQDQQSIRAEIYEGFRKDYDNHITYVDSVMSAMAEGNFTTQHDKTLLIPTHSHRVLQLMSRLRRESVPIMFVKHEEESDEAEESSGSDDDDEDIAEGM